VTDWQHVEAREVRVQVWRGESLGCKKRNRDGRQAGREGKMLRRRWRGTWSFIGNGQWSYSETGATDSDLDTNAGGIYHWPCRLSAVAVTPNPSSVILKIILISCFVLLLSASDGPPASCWSIFPSGGSRKGRVSPILPNNAVLDRVKLEQCLPPCRETSFVV
jgi:hypothetical protein